MITLLVFQRLSLVAKDDFKHFKKNNNSIILNQPELDVANVIISLAKI